MDPPRLVPDWLQRLYDLPTYMALQRAYGSLMEAYRRVRREREAIKAAYLKAQRELAEKDVRIAELEQVIIRKLTGK